MGRSEGNAMDRTGVQATLREMWETRPARPRDGRQVAGVAAGVARRYDIDPVLVRIGFVVAALSGIGAALYIAGWILLPTEPAADGERRRAPHVAVVIGLAVAVALTVGLMFDNGDNDVLLPAVAVAVLLILLHRSRADRGPAPAPAATEAPTAAPLAVALVKDPVTGETVQPPAWDPLGAAPFAWDLPEPSPVEPPSPPRPRRLPVTPVTLGLALLAGGVTLTILLLTGTLTPPNLSVLFGVVLAVVGAGLVVGAFLGTGRGLIPIALVLSAVTWAIVEAPLERFRDVDTEDLRAAPSTVGALQPSYEHGIGDIELDLTGLDLSVTAAGAASPVHTRISTELGDVEITVPRDADVTLTGRSGVGSVTFGDRESSGFGADISVVEDLGEDEARSGRLLVIDVETGAGDVEVRRG